MKCLLSFFAGGVSVAAITLYHHWEQPPQVVDPVTPLAVQQIYYDAAQETGRLRDELRQAQAELDLVRPGPSLPGGELAGVPLGDRPGDRIPVPAIPYPER